MIRLFLVRHGETFWNKERRAQGIKDIKLTEQGKTQGVFLAEKLKNEDIDLIYSSDLSRAYETAKILGDKLDKSVHVLSGIREMNFGKWEGLTIDEIQAKYQNIYAVWGKTPHMAQVPGAETLIQVQERAMKAVYNIINKNPNKNIVLVSHGVAIKVIIFGLLDLDLSNYTKIRQDNTAINIIDVKCDQNVLVQLNDTCHLINNK